MDINIKSEEIFGKDKKIVTKKNVHLLIVSSRSDQLIDLFLTFVKHIYFLKNSSSLDTLMELSFNITFPSKVKNPLSLLNVDVSFLSLTDSIMITKDLYLVCVTFFHRSFPQLLTILPHLFTFIPDVLTEDNIEMLLGDLPLINDQPCSFPYLYSIPTIDIMSGLYNSGSIWSEAIHRLISFSNNSSLVLDVHNSDSISQQTLYPSTYYSSNSYDSASTSHLDTLIPVSIFIDVQHIHKYPEKFHFITNFHPIVIVSLKSPDFITPSRPGLPISGDEGASHISRTLDSKITNSVDSNSHYSHQPFISYDFARMSTDHKDHSSVNNPLQKLNPLNSSVSGFSKSDMTSRTFETFPNLAVDGSLLLRTMNSIVNTLPNSINFPISYEPMEATISKIEQSILSHFPYTKDIDKDVIEDINGNMNSHSKSNTSRTNVGETNGENNSEDYNIQNVGCSSIKVYGDSNVDVVGGSVIDLESTKAKLKNLLYHQLKDQVGDTLSPTSSVVSITTPFTLSSQSSQSFQSVSSSLSTFDCGVTEQKSVTNDIDIDIDSGSGNGSGNVNVDHIVPDHIVPDHIVSDHNSTPIFVSIPQSLLDTYRERFSRVFLDTLTFCYDPAFLDVDTTISLEATDHSAETTTVTSSSVDRKTDSNHTPSSTRSSRPKPSLSQFSSSFDSVIPAIIPTGSTQALSRLADSNSLPDNSHDCHHSLDTNSHPIPSHSNTGHSPQTDSPSPHVSLKHCLIHRVISEFCVRWLEVFLLYVEDVISLCVQTPPSHPSSFHPSSGHCAPHSESPSHSSHSSTSVPPHSHLNVFSFLNSDSLDVNSLGSNGFHSNSSLFSSSLSQMSTTSPNSSTVDSIFTQTCELSSTAVTRWGVHVCTQDDTSTQYLPQVVDTLAYLSILPKTIGLMSHSRPLNSTLNYTQANIDNSVSYHPTNHPTSESPSNGALTIDQLPIDQLLEWILNYLSTNSHYTSYSVENLVNKVIIDSVKTHPSHTPSLLDLILLQLKPHSQSEASTVDSISSNSTTHDVQLKATPLNSTLKTQKLLHKTVHDTANDSIDSTQSPLWLASHPYLITLLMSYTCNTLYSLSAIHSQALPSKQCGRVSFSSQLFLQSVEERHSSKDYLCHFIQSNLLDNTVISKLYRNNILFYSVKLILQILTKTSRNILSIKPSEVNMSTLTPFKNYTSEIAVLFRLIILKTENISDVILFKHLIYPFFKNLPTFLTFVSKRLDINLDNDAINTKEKVIETDSPIIVAPLLNTVSEAVSDTDILKTTPIRHSIPSLENSKSDTGTIETFLNERKRKISYRSEISTKRVNLYGTNLSNNKADFGNGVYYGK